MFFDEILKAVLSTNVSFLWEAFLQFVILSTGIIGYLMIAKKNKYGFYYWIVGDFAIIATSIPNYQYGMTILYTVNTVIAFYSIREWSKDKEGGKSNSFEIKSDNMKGMPNVAD